MVIVAYKRTNFLVYAIESVLKQTLDRSYYEIVVITDFPWNLEEEYIKHGVRFIRDARKEFCKKLSSALSLLNGTIVCILDDDDIFFPNKLSRIIEIFSRDDKILFIQNNMRVINEHGGIVKKQLYGNEYLSRERILNIKSYEDLRNLIKLKLGFNGSSISVRREVLIENIKILSQMEGSIEAFLLFSSLSLEGKLFYDNNVLTGYRIHSKNNSVASLNLRTRSEMYRRHLSDWICLAGFSAVSDSRWLKEVIDEQIIYFSIMAEIFSIDVMKRKVFILLPSFIRKYHLSPSLKFIVYFISLASLFSIIFSRFLVSVLSIMSWKALK